VSKEVLEDSINAIPFAIAAPSPNKGHEEITSNGHAKVFLGLCGVKWNEEKTNEGVMLQE